MINFSYTKFLIYSLTFITYAYSGYGSGILNNLRDAVMTAESVFGDVFENVINVAKKFKNIHEIFNEAVEEECTFTCPGGITPRKNKNHVPKSDGCGSYGININRDFLPLSEMTKCCDAHDICYDTCLSVKEACDVDFKRCLYRYCDSYGSSAIGEKAQTACKAAAKMLFTGTLTLGCKSYKDAQKEACYCSANKKFDSKSSKWTRGDGEL